MRYIHRSKIAVSILFASILFSATQAQSEDKLKSHFNSLISWLKDNNGYIHPSLQMRRENESDPTSIFGLFTESDLDEGTLLFSIPQEMIIRSADNEPRQLNCGLVRALIEELNKKDESAYAPYIMYLLDTQIPGQLPSGWSDAGKEMLMKALGDEDFSIVDARARYTRYNKLGLANTLPPAEPISWLEDVWLHECDGEMDELSQYAAFLVLQRSWDDILIPIYDMMNHRNGVWFNTRNDENGVHSGESINVFTSRDIYAGEQIYGSYNMCDDCGGRMSTYGTSHIFRDYGFVEDMPQTWIFPDIGIRYRIDELEEKNEDGDPQYVVVEWIHDEEPTAGDYEVLKEKIEYIKERIQIIKTRSNWSDIPGNEWGRTMEYMNALKRAVEVALAWFDENALNQETCIADGTCTIKLDQYTDLDLVYNTVLEKGYPEDSCDIDVQLEKLKSFDEIDSTRSQYQKISFIQDLNSRDTCMDLDVTLQICGSYRPHYHEYMVHQAARFLPKGSIKRILFVGGGDSMLLHEILKYPSIELVVGLELDQMVTRKCFKHFGTQPHFDDDRVEWWFGDASKSLLMLPKDYFASFDLVLVDLSETVMSFTVSKELTVLEALTLLVKPGGIFVKNEVYFEEFKNIFPYTVQVTWQDNPVICAQVMVMGSRTVDFMNPLTGPILFDHSIENFVVRRLDEIEDNFELYHDYAVNTTCFNLCDSMASADLDDIQLQSSGTLLIAEIEGINGDLSAKGLEGAMILSLKKDGMTIRSSDVTQNINNTTAFVVVRMKEGYVFARAIPEEGYVGFDIHLWSSMYKQNRLINGIVSTIGDGFIVLSSYRIITGGMFGIDSWMEDKEMHGPQFKELCDRIKKASPLVTKHKNSGNESDVFTAIKQVLTLVGQNDLSIAILVGNNEGSEKSSDSLISTISKSGVVSRIAVLDCPSIANFNRFSEFMNAALSACEKHLRNVIMNNSDIKLFDAIIIDNSADKVTSSILLKILSIGPLSKTLQLDSIVIAWSISSDEDSWKKNLMLRFKDEVFGHISADAAFANIVVENKDADSVFNIMITNYGLENFVHSLNRTIVEFNSIKRNHLFANVEILNGGAWWYQEDFEPSRVFLPGDYDHAQSLTQWKSQKATGHQVILQIEPDAYSGLDIVQMTESILSEAINLAMKEVDLVNWDAQSVKKSCDVGEGCLFLALFDNSTLAVLWDGRSHIDINIFNSKEDIDLVDDFVQKFLQSIPTHSIILRDEQPRGFGRIVAYQSDISDGKIPHWA